MSDFLKEAIRRAEQDVRLAEPPPINPILRHEIAAEFERVASKIADAIRKEET